MNKSNHKAIGRYCYGGKFYAGDCPCGKEYYVSQEQLEQLANNYYFHFSRHGNKLFQKVFSLFL